MPDKKRRMITLAVSRVACSLPSPWPPILLMDGPVQSLCWPKKAQGSSVSELRAQSIPRSAPGVGRFARDCLISPGSQPQPQRHSPVPWLLISSTTPACLFWLSQSCLTTGPFLGLSIHCKFLTNTSARLLEPD